MKPIGHDMKGAALLLVHQMGGEHHRLQVNGSRCALHANAGVGEGDRIDGGLTLQLHQHLEKGLRVLDVDAPGLQVGAEPWKASLTRSYI